MMPAAFLLELRIAAHSLLRRPSFTVPAALTPSSRGASPVRGSAQPPDRTTTRHTPPRTCFR